jgi:hypothetical protein
MNLKTRTLAALVASVFLFATVADAQTSRPDKSPTTSMFRLSAPQVGQILAGPRPESFTPSQWASTRAPSHERVNRKMAGLILGGLVGFGAGTFIGAGIIPNCACDDPGLRGSVIGASIGTALGAIAGFKLGSR